MGLAGSRKYFPSLEDWGHNESCFLKATTKMLTALLWVGSQLNSVRLLQSDSDLDMERRLSLHAASRQSHVACTQINPITTPTLFQALRTEEEAGLKPEPHYHGASPGVSQRRNPRFRQVIHPAQSHTVHKQQNYHLYRSCYTGVAPFKSVTHSAVPPVADSWTFMGVDPASCGVCILPVSGTHLLYSSVSCPMMPRVEGADFI